MQPLLRKVHKKEKRRHRGAACNRACKPGSVNAPKRKPQSSIFTGRLRSVQRKILLPPMGCRRATVCRMAAPICGVASDRVYICTQLPAMPVSSYLAFPSLPLARRFISVALSLGSPPADVIRYPALRSPDFPHDTTFRHDTARLRRPLACFIIAQTLAFVKLFFSTVSFAGSAVRGKARQPRRP